MISPAQYARRLGVHTSTVYRAIARGEIKTERVGRRIVIADPRAPATEGERFDKVDQALERIERRIIRFEGALLSPMKPATKEDAEAYLAELARAKGSTNGKASDLRRR